MLIGRQHGLVRRSAPARIMRASYRSVVVGADWDNAGDKTALNGMEVQSNSDRLAVVTDPGTMVAG
ncbi:hypothetical protein [Cryptosporangium phraense]|uniref:Uncharacterized protein n=1 Tax=Cryptosporangium phraense TaxID=2593070 RepID=A0A545AK62_9ACTN|nr:hypothetical protein [Cryptosporangium phraense]TQS41708.1 hypothetical protein FL583_28120 [Cryptosporangium phraense]